MEIRISKVTYDEERLDESARWIKRLIEQILVKEVGEDLQVKSELLHFLEDR